MPSRRRSTLLFDAINKAKQPIMCSGGGVLWSKAWNEMQAFVEKAGIPFYTTPQGRGVVPDDHPYSYLTMRNSAFRDADLIIILGTRMNYVIGHAAPPRFNKDATIARIEIDPEELGTSARNVDIPIVGDCKSVLLQLIDAIGDKTADRFQGWRQKLADGEAAKRTGPGGNYPTDGDIHPLRLCEEVKNFMNRDAILCVDGQEILNFGRQSIPTFTPGHRLNSGPFGTMGVGLPFAVGAKAAKPGTQVICLHGDGSFGQNAMELDTAVRHKLPLMCIISLNGGWTADPERNKPGRDLGYTRYDILAQGLGCHGEYVDSPRTSARLWSGHRKRWTRAWWHWSMSRPTSRPRHDGPILKPHDLNRQRSGTARGALGRLSLLRAQEPPPVFAEKIQGGASEMPETFAFSRSKGTQARAP